MNFFPENIKFNTEIFSCSRDVKSGVIFIPFTTSPDIRLGDMVYFQVGSQELELKIVDIAIQSSEGIGTHHPKLLELHTENLTAAAHKTKDTPQMINIGTLNGQQIQVGNNNTQHINITIEQLTKEISKSNDPKAKSLLKGLLENATVSSVIGAGASALLALL
jgi:hypothetical protein